MKEKIHPGYYDVTVTCACGNSWDTRSTRETLKTDVCSKCHPFFTGEQRIVDTAGQVERFMRRIEQSQNLQDAAESRRQAKEERRKARLLIELPDEQVPEEGEESEELESPEEAE